MPAHSSRLALHTQRRQSLILGALALLLFVLGEHNQAAIGFDSRFILFAKEMLRHGPSFFPTTYGQPYPDYSATSTLFIWLLSAPFGQVTSLTAWLPTALASAVIVMLTWRLVAPHSRQWALMSVALLVLSMTFITETRAVSLDQMLAAVSLGVFYLAYAHDHLAAPRRHAGLLALLVLGFAIRGPIGLVIPAGMLCVYYVLSGQWRRMLTTGLQALALLVACIGVLLALAWVSGGETFVREVIRMQVTGRMDGTEGASSVLYYFTSSIGNYALAYPLAALVLLTLALTGRTQTGAALTLVKYCAGAGLIVMIGLSIPQAKKARYLLPMLPMAAIIAAYPFQVTQGRAFMLLRGVTLGLFLLMPGMLMAGLVLARQRLGEQLPELTTALAVLGLLQLVAVGALFKAQWRTTLLAFCAVLAVWSTFIMVYEPFERRVYDTREFTHEAMRLIDQTPLPLVVHGMGKDAKAIKFMVNVDRDVQPLFTQTPAQLEALNGQAWIIMDRTDYQGLQGTLLGNTVPVLSARFDKNEVVLLKKP
ncbi:MULTISPECIES: glycosyltransferase family 39 protein [unclassified Pseudomonas]|uniref:ArnT family glycosyltransferase n=1 Tax=unclassified Pseudomonas TaxID=196821 RepID=UPI0014756F5A|nr:MULTISPECIES: glycosyltransferase family 39 protein [unclassified Pseudomonas]NMY36459.1 phospholipid carrier-dependent glycosyltransferase [Pseudomonas sp. WS 5078]NMY59200.1 phospholipid carrier-dependent glycosyltransferase [Pseudomonas sp. WS 5354]